jgi:sugar O-acyltransferase (sialic acid O-acetyltransferase NeuD family)
MTKEKLVIFPFNGNAIEALDCIDQGKFELIGFIDDDPLKSSSTYEILPRSILRRHPEFRVLAVPGSPSTYLHRSEIIKSLDIHADKYITAIHPSASIGKQVTLGHNCLVMAGVVITSNARLQSHVCILPNTVIHHDVVVGAYSLVGSNVVIGGGTTIGKNCYVGSGSNIINGIQVGDFSLIGLGSNVIRDVPVKAKFAGNPARPVQLREI